MKTEEMKVLATSVIEDGHAQNLEEDDVKMNMFAKKIPFSKLNSLYKSISIELGHITDPKEVTTGVNALLPDIPWDTYETWDQVEPVISQIQEHVDGAQSARVIALIRAYCRENEIELPRKPKGSAGGGPRSSKLAETIIALVRENPESTKAEAYIVISPLVGGAHKHRNTLYYVNTMFAICVATLSGTPLPDVLTALRAQTDPADEVSGETPTEEPDEDEVELTEEELEAATDPEAVVDVEEDEEDDL